jgi:hypothetical protein
MPTKGILYETEGRRGQVVPSRQQVPGQSLGWPYSTADDGKNSRLSCTLDAALTLRIADGHPGSTWQLGHNTRQV